MSSENITTESSDESEIEKLKPLQKDVDEQESTAAEKEIDKEIRDEQYTDFRTKIEILVQLGENELRSYKLSDCYTTDRPGMHLEILPKMIFEAADDEASLEEIEIQKPIFRLTVDQGTQASIEFKSSSAQTLRRRLVNSWSQYEPRLFTEDEIQNHMNQLSFQVFRERTEKSLLGSLVQNSIADCFFWDLTSLYDEETSLQDEEQSLVISGSFSCAESKEHDRMISSINWHPLYKDIFVTSTISCLTLEKRTENLLNLQNDTIMFFMWNARNQFFPKAILEYFDDLTVMKFNPLKPNLLVASSLSGQLILWDLKQEICNKDDDINGVDSTGGFTTPPIIQCCAISNMDHIHRYGVTDLLWVPSNFEISYRGDIVKNTPTGYQIVTCGLDGFSDPPLNPNTKTWCARLICDFTGLLFLHFWDLRMGFQSKPGNPFPKKFNQLNATWEPFHSVEVFSKESKKRKALTRFQFRNYPVPVVEDDEDITEDDYIKSEFYAGCDDGQILCGSFKLIRDESGKFITEQSEYYNSILEGSVTVLACSPFISDIFLSAGGKTTAIWEHYIKSTPVYLRERNAYITSGQWSPTRPALFLLGFQDGSIEVWDLLINLYQPSVTHFMSTSAITAVSIQSISENEHVVAAGDSKGVVYSMNLLPGFWIPRENEEETFKQMIVKEANRILNENQSDLEDIQIQEKIPKNKPFKHLEDSIKPEEIDETVLANNYEEFLKLQEQELKNMNLNLEEDEDALSNEEN